MEVLEPHENIVGTKRFGTKRMVHVILRDTRFNGPKLGQTKNKVRTESRVGQNSMGQPPIKMLKD